MTHSDYVHIPSDYVHIPSVVRVPIDLELPTYRVGRAYKPFGCHRIHTDGFIGPILVRVRVPAEQLEFRAQHLKFRAQHLDSGP